MKTSKKLPLLLQRKFFLYLLAVSILFVTCKKTTIINNYITNLTTYSAGLIPTPDATYSSIPTATLPISGGGNLPSSHFIEIPTTPFNQGNQGSCASCATAMAKSILDHIKNGTQYPNNKIIYSPSYLFHQVNLNPNNCSEGGSYLASNFEILKAQGVCKLADMEYSETDCTTLPTDNQKILAASNKIDHYYRIDPINASTIKQFINVGIPVIVAFKVDNHFTDDYQDPNNVDKVWSSFGTYSNTNHATLLYGWDDNKNAFKMLNQWGGQWGNNGSIWVDYDLVSNRNVFFEAYILQNGPTTNINNLQVTGDLIFGNTTINTNSTKSLQLINNGTTSINVSSISITSPFSINWNGGIIQAGESQAVTVTFNPSIVGNANSILTINSNASNSPTTIQASGVGVEQNNQTKVISLSGNLTFGNVTVGQSASTTLTISNTGNSALTVSSISAPQGFLGSFSGTIQAGNSSNVTITFSPSNAQAYSGNVVVNSDATSGTNTINASGNGISGGSGVTVTPPLGTYGNCESSGIYYCNNNPLYGTGTINAKVVSINTSTNQIVFEIKKCDGTNFNYGGNINVVSDLCTGSSYYFKPFSSGSKTVQLTVTDNDMASKKDYYLFIVQQVSGFTYQYNAPKITVTY